ncbi:hypothetical protein LNI98_07295 [Tenacibaculum dicentrarchi]|nr:hypothetical protein [Tenacibaculum dicentrarchi]
MTVYLIFKHALYMKNFITIFFIAILLLFSCDLKKENIKDLDVINDVFSDLFINDYSFEGFRDYKQRIYTEDELEKIGFDSLYVEYKKNRKIKKTLNVFINETLTSVNNKTLELVLNIDDYDLKSKEEINFNPTQEIKLSKNISFSSYESATVARYVFSRVYINKRKNKAFFVLKFDCLDGCYSEHIIYLSRKDNKWSFDRDQTLLAV